MRVKTTIRPDGTVTVAVVGGQGPSCEEAIRPYTRHLPAGADARPTDDYYQAVTEDVTEREFA